MIRGAYAYPGALWETGARLDAYGVNAVCIHGGSLGEAAARGRDRRFPFDGMNVWRKDARR